MNYYINSHTVKKRKTGRIILSIAAYVLVFALSFFVSFRLVAGTQSGTQEIEALRQEIEGLNSQLAVRDERIASLELQIENLEKSLAEKETEAIPAPSADGDAPVR